MTGGGDLALATRGLRKSYGSRRALDGLDLSVPSGVVLTINPGTTVKFTALNDDQGGGDNTSRSELIVQGIEGLLSNVIGLPVDIARSRLVWVDFALADMLMDKMREAGMTGPVPLFNMSIQGDTAQLDISFTLNQTP